MKLKLRLSLIVSIILVSIIAVVAINLVVMANRSLTKSSMEYMEALTGIASGKIQAEMENYLDIIQTISWIMDSFEDVDVYSRRSRFDGIMESIIKSVPEMAGICSVWKPGVLDNSAIPYRTWFHRRREIQPEKDDYNNSGVNWQAILDNLTEKPQVSNVLKGMTNGKEIDYINIIVPIIPADGQYRGQKVGFVAVNVNLDFAEKMIVNIRPYEELAVKLGMEPGRAVLYANDGSIAAHYTAGMIGKSIDNPESLKILGRVAVDDTLETLKTGEAKSGQNGGRFFYSYPFNVGDSGTAWTVLSSVEERVVLSDIYDMVKAALIVALVSIIGGVVVVWFASGSIAKRIVSVGLAMKDISEGEGDLTKRITVKANDEIGDMGKYFNSTIEKIRALVLAIKGETVMLSDIGTELSSNMTETAAAINQITSNIQSIKGQVVNQSASVTETNSTMNQIVQNIDRLGELVEKQMASVSQSSSAIEEMLANIQSVTQTLVKNGDNVKQLADASEVGRSGLQDVAQDIQQIARESEGLLEINSVMENIASQTNLLSMNAAIEAAHAGEAGKGFAVVADEIRKLAESSGEQSKTISAVLKKIKDSIDKITRSTDAVLNKFEAIDNGVRTVSDQEHNIRNAMEEQTAGSQQILEAVNRLNEVTTLVKDSTTEMLEGSQQVITESRNLENVTQELENGMNEMASGAEQINIAVNRVNTISDDNKQRIDKLVSEVSKFIVE
ncbi:MAG: methyl-accepting chemotaxis protein [Spirochaetaceae bacterium]|jgi:methyl-accepting chemotaxis protein|nr:methyl-accepting chemotaxis protein [Spirochaetaceae bacterium]